MLPAPSAVATGQVEERVSYERFNKQTVAQLKELCNEWGLPRGGNKGVLVKDETWEAYYKERSALEYRFRSETRKPEALASAADAGAEDNQQPEEVEGVPLPWEHDWPQPKLPNICTESYTEEPHKDLKELHERIAARLASILRGCPSLKDRAQLEKNIKSSFYIVSYWANWEDEAWGSPRTVDVHGRLYAPTGTGAAIDVKYHYHNRMRMTFTESFNHISAGIRTSFSATGPTSEANSHQIWSADAEVRNTYKRKATTKQNLEELGEALFGSRTTVSARKVWSLLLYTGGVSNFADNNEAAFRVMRRRIKLSKGEDSEGRSDRDRDSGNDNRVKKRAQKRKASNAFGGFGGGRRGWGGFGGLGFM